MESEIDNGKLKKRIGIFSGSFNPIHLGHQKLAEYLIENKLVDELWLVVSPCNPFKNSAELIDEYIRLDMVLLAIKNQSLIKASDVEFTMPIPSYSIDTLHFLAKQNHDYQFILIIGSDNALVFDQWKNFRLLLDEFQVMVYPRRGYDVEKVAAEYPTMQILQTPFFDISSTQIRCLIADGKDASEFLHPDVYNFIRENELYV
jgi:nicotinate-nucleotide adenylyltransferase